MFMMATADSGSARSTSAWVMMPKKVSALPPAGSPDQATQS